MGSKYKYTTVANGEGQVFEAKLEELNETKIKNEEENDKVENKNVEILLGGYYIASEIMAEYMDEMNDGLELGNAATISELIQNYYINKNN